MSTDSCGRCGEPAPAALLRNVQLRVDGDEVDEQTLCPDCFADWIARYQGEMAGDMPGADDSTEESVGGDITIADEEEPAPDVESSALSQAVDAAREQAEGGAQATARSQSSDLASHPTGDEIQEVEGESTTDSGGGDEIEIDLEAEIGNGDEDDGGGLL